MAATILAPQGKNQYQLCESDRQKIISAAPTPDGAISTTAMSIIQRQRQTFIAANGDDGTQTFH